MLKTGVSVGGNKETLKQKIGLVSMWAPEEWFLNGSLSLSRFETCLNGSLPL